MADTRHRERTSSAKRHGVLRARVQLFGGKLASSQRLHASLLCLRSYPRHSIRSSLEAESGLHAPSAVCTARSSMPKCCDAHEDNCISYTSKARRELPDRVGRHQESQLGGCMRWNRSRRLKRLAEPRAQPWSASSLLSSNAAGTHTRHGWTLTACNFTQRLSVRRAQTSTSRLPSPRWARPSNIEAAPTVPNRACRFV